MSSRRSRLRARRPRRQAEDGRSVAAARPLAELDGRRIGVAVLELDPDVAACNRPAITLPGDLAANITFAFSPHRLPGRHPTDERLPRDSDRSAQLAGGASRGASRAALASVSWGHE
jgi:hypothetical protein